MKEGSTGLLQQVCSLSDEKSMPADSAIKPNITQPLMALFHCMVRYGSARLGTVRYGSVRVGLRFHRSLVPL